MTDKPSGVACLKWDYQGHHFHEHATFTGFKGLQSAEYAQMDLLGRASNAAKAIDAGEMPSVEQFDELNQAVGDDVRGEFAALDKVRAKDEADKALRKIREEDE